MDFDECACSGKSLARLLRPAIMGTLAKGGAHGYELAQRLREMKMFAGDLPDHAGLYRALNHMEQEGYLVSRWDTEHAGPARKIFKLTSAGRACLAQWRETLRGYRQGLDELLRLLGRAR
ncbi:MAG: helix-turn-helix transcriptional regulator [Phycisphaerales bacterium]|nr:MAG: helix-turn-helix transcriptional regulator [Phycisphaerales bacterium]